MQDIRTITDASNRLRQEVDRDNAKLNAVKGKVSTDTNEVNRLKTLEKTEENEVNSHKAKLSEAHGALLAAGRQLEKDKMEEHTVQAEHDKEYRELEHLQHDLQAAEQQAKRK